MSIFWKDKPSILFENITFKNLFPNKDMNKVEWYNSLTRLLLLIVLTILSTIGMNKILLLPLITILIIYFNKDIKSDDFIEGFRDSSELEGLDAIRGLEGSEGVEGSEGNRQLINQIDCQKPTFDNPFMNGLAGDNPARPPACTDKANQKIAEQYLDHDLYKDVNDLWDKRNSQRQFYTNSNTQTPNDREEFMKFCWATPYVCKDGDQNHCLKYEDLRVPGYS